MAETLIERKHRQAREAREKALWKMMSEVGERDDPGESDLHRALRLAWLRGTQGEQAMTDTATWGRYETRDIARLACNRFEDQPGAYHRVRYSPSKRYPKFPWAVLVFGWEDEADLVDANGEVRR